MLALPGALVTEQPAALSTRLAAQSLRRIAPRTTAQDPGTRDVLDRLRILPLLNVLPTQVALAISTRSDSLEMGHALFTLSRVFSEA